MSGLWQSIDEIAAYYNSMPGNLPKDQPRKLVKRVGPVVHFSTQDFDEPDVEDDDVPDEDDFAEEIDKLPFDEWDEDEQ